MTKWGRPLIGMVTYGLDDSRDRYGCPMSTSLRSNEQAARSC